jgi:hypothetical protein
MAWPEGLAHCVVRFFVQVAPPRHSGSGMDCDALSDQSVRRRSAALFKSLRAARDQGSPRLPKR